MFYTVQYVRGEDGLWSACVKEETGVRTQGRSISEARSRVREALAAAIGASRAAAAQLVDAIEIPAKMRRAIENLKKAQQRAEQRQQIASKFARKIARELVRERGLSLRDAGEVMGVSGGRVQQLLK